MNALKSAIVSRLQGDATLTALFPTNALVNGVPRVSDKVAPQSTTANPVVLPYIIYQVQADDTQFHEQGRAAKVLLFLIKAVDSGDSSKRAGQIDERIEELFHPNEPLSVTGHRTGFQGRTSRVDMTTTESGVKYQHVGGVYRITLIPV